MRVDFAGRAFESEKAFLRFYGLNKDALARQRRLGVSGENVYPCALRSLLFAARVQFTRLRPCNRCGTLVASSSGHCCKSCEGLHGYTPVRQCSVCGCWHKRGYDGGKWQTCPACTQLMKKVSQDRQRERIAAIRRDQRRFGLIEQRGALQRHKKHGVKVIDKGITAASVAKRDGYICALCGCEVERHAGGKSHQPRGWTVGHIIPLAFGGHTTWGNVQCECVACNSMKGNRIDADTLADLLAFMSLARVDAVKQDELIDRFMRAEDDVRLDWKHLEAANARHA